MTPGIAVIGLGQAAAVHMLALRDLADRVRLRWAASPNPARTAAFGAEWGVPVTNDVATAIADPAVDAVLVLTPPDTHRDICAQAFACGKHVLVEKPLAATIADAEAIVAAARAADRRLGVVLQHRFRPAARRLRSLLDDDALGAVQAAHVHLPWWRGQDYYDEAGRGTLARDGGGVLMTQAIHVIDLLRSLIGDLDPVASLVRTTALHRMEGEDHVAALLRGPSGCAVSLVASTASYPGRAETIEIIGSRGSARLAGQSLDVAWFDGRSDRIDVSGASGSGPAIMDFPHYAHRDLLADFLDAVSRGAAPLVFGEEALKTQRLIADLLVAAQD